MRQKMKSILALVLSAALIVGLLPTAALASGQADGGRTSPVVTDTQIYINPLYADVIDASDLKKPSRSAVAPAAADVYYTSLEEAGAQVREQLKQRKETFVIKYSSPSYSKELAKEIFDTALEHTGVPTEGDYLYWQFAGWRAEISYSMKNGAYDITFTYTVTYYTTKAQEERVDSEVKSLLSQWKLGEASDYDKVKRIYDYICSSVTYDYVNLGNDSYKLKHTAYAALIDKKAVCQGYAVLFYRLALELGLDARLIAGKGNNEAHGWNIVRINNVYYNLDSTWDAGVSPSKYRYFLKGTKDFPDHVSDVEYLSADFQAKYPISGSAITQSEIQHVHSYGKPQFSWDGSYGCTSTVACAGCHEMLNLNCTVTAQTTEATCQAEGKTVYTAAAVFQGTSYTDTRTETIDKKPHTIVIDPAVEATCTQEGKTEGSHCGVCGAVLTEQEKIAAAGHVAVTDPAVEATCTQEGRTEGSHCGVCGAVLTEQGKIAAAGHVAVADPAVEATCTKEGRTEGSHCGVCGAVLTKQEKMAAVGHVAVTDPAVAATSTKEGRTEGSHCSVCNAVIKRQETIASPGIIVLSKSSQAYSGRAFKPAVEQVRDSAGAVISSDNYTVSYSDESCKDAGTYQVIVTFKGEKYSGTMKESFKVTQAAQTIQASSKTKTVGDSFSLGAKRTKGDGALSYKSSNNKVATVSGSGKVTVKGTGKAKITITAKATKNYKKAVKTVTVTGTAPKGVKLSAVKNSGAKKMTVTWKKNTAVTGYQLQYAANSRFSGAKEVTVKSSKTTKTTISKLKKGTTYCVRIRTYKKVSGKTYYSGWSAVKKVKIIK